MQNGIMLSQNICCIWQNIFQFNVKNLTAKIEHLNANIDYGAESGGYSAHHVPTHESEEIQYYR